MDIERAKKIIHYVAEITRWRWEQYDEHWSEIDKVFIQRGYEQGGFACWEFAKF